MNPRVGAALLTRSSTEARTAASRYGYTADAGVPFRAAASAAPGLVRVHRLWNARHRDFLWLPEGPQMSAALARYGYVDRGVDFAALSQPVCGAVPVFRLFRGGHYRLAATDLERSALTAAGWYGEQVAFFAAPGGTGRPDAADTRFTLATIPDTQNETLSPYDTRFRQRSEWLVANRSVLDLRYVLHSGDVVNWGWLVPSQYAVARAAMAPVERAGLPYTLAVGNHDTRAVGWDGKPGSRGYGGAAYVGNPECPYRLGAAACKTHLLVRQTQEFNANFTAARYRQVTGAYEPGKVDNISSTFSAGGRDWLVLTLELWPRSGVVEWARRVVASHPRHNVIVVTHAYLNGNGTIGQDNGGYGATSPQYLYDRLIRVYPNIKLVFSGHTGVAATRVDTGAAGNRIVSFLQTFHSPDTNPVRLTSIDVAGGSVSSVVVAPKDRRSFPQYAARVGGLSWVR